jgi:hypothetical protein
MEISMRRTAPADTFEAQVEVRPGIDLWLARRRIRARAATGAGGQPVALAARRRRHEEPATTPAGMSAWAINVSVRRP